MSIPINPNQMSTHGVAWHNIKNGNDLNKYGFKPNDSAWHVAYNYLHATGQQPDDHSVAQLIPSLVYASNKSPSRKAPKITNPGQISVAQAQDLANVAHAAAAGGAQQGGGGGVQASPPAGNKPKGALHEQKNMEKFSKGKKDNGKPLAKGDYIEGRDSDNNVCIQVVDSVNKNSNGKNVPKYTMHVDIWNPMANNGGGAWELDQGNNTTNSSNSAAS